ncbi:MAG: hypothetical protein DHS20C21_02170 [Gemmatimonadota bacterium]|nr:MAG: hypothetical protein DHS20C21_02170 [Gemmatimonadota bacterium]
MEAGGERAAAAEARLSAILAATVDAIVAIDERGRIDVFSAAAERMFGWKAREMVGQNVNRLMPNPYRPAHDGFLETYLRTGIPKVIGIGRRAVAVRRNGEEFPVELTVGEIASYGEGRRFVGLIRDITETLRIEEEAKELRDRLTRVGRVSTLGEMVAGIAHEINQPLTAIASSAQALSHVLKPDRPLTDEHRQIIDEIAEQALRAGDVIDRLRRLARREEAPPAVRDPNRVVRDVVRLATLDARANEVSLELDLQEGLPAVTMDEVQIQQVVLNLVRNAVDATTASTSVAGAAHPVVVRTRAAAGDRVQFSVTDRGTGVTPEEAEGIFEPFFTTKEGGMGLGLSISRSIIAAHGGVLDYVVDPDTGTTFRFTLPIHGKEATG